MEVMRKFSLRRLRTSFETLLIVIVDVKINVNVGHDYLQSHLLDYLLPPYIARSIFTGFTRNSGLNNSAAVWGYLQQGTV